MTLFRQLRSLIAFGGDIKGFNLIKAVHDRFLIATVRRVPNSWRGVLRQSGEKFLGDKEEDLHPQDVHQTQRL